MTVTSETLGTALGGVTGLSPTLAFVTGERALLESVVRRWLSPEGGLWYDPEHGGGLMSVINSTDPDGRRIESKLVAQANLDPRVASCTVVVTWQPETKTLAVVGRITAETGQTIDLTLTIDAVTGKVLLESSL